LSDKLNRLRHFHYFVDSKGRIWRIEIDKPGKLFGVLKEDQYRDTFFKYLKKNTTGLYLPDFPYLSTRGKELYFVTTSNSPIVFTQLQNEHLHFAATLKIPFNPTLLHMKDDYLYHPIQIPYSPREGDERELSTIWGLLEKNLSYTLYSTLEEKENVFYLRWKGKEYPVKRLESVIGSGVKELPDQYYIQHNTKWWADD